VAQAGQHAADLAVATFSDRYLYKRPGAVPLQQPHLRLTRASLGQVHAARHLPHVRRRDLACHGGDIRLGHLVPGVRQAVGEVAVIGHEERAARINVKPPHREQPRPRVLEEIDRPAAAGGVVIRAHHAHGLVEKPVFGVLQPQPLSVQSDVLRLGVGLDAQFGRQTAINRDAAGQDDRLACPPRAPARTRQQFLKSFGSHSRRLLRCPRNVSSAEGSVYHTSSPAGNDFGACG
jgi:hypothetical protein